MDDDFWNVIGRTKWPRDPHEYIFLGRVVDAVGAAMFEEWTENDTVTRYGPTPTLLAASPSTHLSVKAEDVQTTDEADRLLRRLRPDIPRPPRPNIFRRANLVVQDRPEYLRFTQEEWSAAKEAATKLAADIRASGERLQKVRLAIATGAERDELPIYYRSNGKMLKTPPHWWNTDLVAQRFTWCQINPKQPFARGIGGEGYCQLFLLGDDVERFLRGLPRGEVKVRSEDLSRFSPLLRFAVALATRWNTDANWSPPTHKILVWEIQKAWKEAHGTDLTRTPADYIARILKFPQ